MISTAQNTKYAQYVDMAIITCYKCGIPFGVPVDYKLSLHKTQESFCCPNGHSQCYSKSTAEILQEKLEKLTTEKAISESRLRAEAENWQRQWENQLKEKKKVAAKLKRTEKRIAHGVCPCCNRTFQDLARHMETKHPEILKK